tara:strand:+ start:491 stop:742 length:252 start_codon:yes stop_codon:yes gene_type:complete
MTAPAKAIFDVAAYLLNIIDQGNVVGANTTGILLKFLVSKGLILVNQGSGNGEGTGFTSLGNLLAARVVQSTGSELILGNNYQ